MFPSTWFIVLIVSLTGTSFVTGNILRAKRSPITFPLAKRVNLTGIHNLVQHDQARAKLLKAQGAAKASGLNVHNDRAVISSTAINEGVSYVAPVGIGSPATTYSLVVDTGSPFIFIDTTNEPFVATGSVAESITCSTGSFSGKVFLDTVTITPSLVLHNQPICVGTSSGFADTDGILGLGPSDLTLDTLSPPSPGIVPGIVQNAFSAGIISADEISISFEPTTSSDSSNGELTWGGTDSTRFTGTILFSPITTTSPSSEFWGINQSIRYGTSTILAETAGIVDTGTTLILIASNAFSKYEEFTGGVLDSKTGLLKVTTTQFSDLESLFFQANGGTFELTANAQIWPRALNSLIGGTAGTIYLIVGDIGTDSGSGLDFVNGQTFLERFYLVLDFANQSIGLANTSFTHATTN